MIIPLCEDHPKKNSMLDVGLAENKQGCAIIVHSPGKYDQLYQTCAKVINHGLMGTKNLVAMPKWQP